MDTQAELKPTPNTCPKGTFNVHFSDREPKYSLEQLRDPGITIATKNLSFQCISKVCFHSLSVESISDCVSPTPLVCSPPQLLRELLLQRAEEAICSRCP